MKISIITVCFNSEQTISDTISSVLNQQYNDYEYIVVDGGSKDNTVNILKKYEPKFNGKMRWISEKDNGLYDAMNKGIKMADGDIVGIINSDDFYHRNDVFTLIDREFNTKEVDAVYGDVRFVHPDNLDKTVRYYSSRIFRPALFRFGFMPAHPTFFTYKKYFDAFGYYKMGYKIAADFELLVRFLYIHKLKTGYLRQDILKMRTGGVSTQGVKSTILPNKEIIRACKDNGLWTCSVILYLRYFIKIFEKVFVK